MPPPIYRLTRFRDRMLDPRNRRSTNIEDRRGWSLTPIDRPPLLPTDPAGMTVQRARLARDEAEDALGPLPEPEQKKRGLRKVRLR